MSRKICTYSITALMFLFIALIVSIENVFALSKQSNTTYENSNGVIVSEKEYQFINDFYDSEYFESMTSEDYEWIEDLDIDESEVEIKESIEDTVSLAGTLYTNNGRSLKIAKSCSSGTCTIVVKVQWLLLPTIRSWDVIGARLSNTSLTSSSITTKVAYGDITTYYSGAQKFTSGFGTSVELPSGNNTISIEQKYYVTTGGTVYASYQHSIKEITEATSKLYSISSKGSGSTFKFYGAALNAFDNTAGVNITT